MDNFTVTLSSDDEPSGRKCIVSLTRPCKETSDFALNLDMALKCLFEDEYQGLQAELKKLWDKEQQP